MALSRPDALRSGATGVGPCLPQPSTYKSHVSFLRCYIYSRLQSKVRKKARKRVGQIPDLWVGTIPRVVHARTIAAELNFEYNDRRKKIELN